MQVLDSDSESIERFQLTLFCFTYFLLFNHDQSKEWRKKPLFLGVLPSLKSGPCQNHKITLKNWQTFGKSFFYILTHWASIPIPYFAGLKLPANSMLLLTWQTMKNYICDANVIVVCFNLPFFANLVLRSICNPYLTVSFSILIAINSHYWWTGVQES